MVIICNLNGQRWVFPCNEFAFVYMSYFSKVPSGLRPTQNVNILSAFHWKNNLIFWLKFHWIPPGNMLALIQIMVLYWIGSKLFHDDVIKWKHLPHYWPFVWGIHQPPVNSPHKGQWHGALMFSLTCSSINGGINNGEAGGLRCHCAHYDIIVMHVTVYWCIYGPQRVNFVNQYLIHIQSILLYWGGVTKPPVVNFSVSKFLILQKYL